MKKYIIFILSIAIIAIFAATGFADVVEGLPEDDPTANSTYVIDSPSTEWQPPTLNAYGIQDYSQLNISTRGFSPFSDGQWSHAASGWSWRSGGFNMATGYAVHIPSGANIEGITVWLHDNDAAGYIKYWFRRIDLVDNSNITIITVTTIGQPGTVRQYFPVGHVVNNDRYAYYVYIDHSVTGSTLQNSGVTFWYKRRVNTNLPNPFTDIGGLNARFQNAIKALAASGITKGCTPTQYCPYNNLTRGEMAVFLAEALGLHFPD